MKKINFDFLPERLRLWTPPLIGIPVMLAFGLSVKAAGYLLFGHHLFWMVGIFLLINPVSETFWPGPGTGKSKSRPAPPRRTAKSRQRAGVSKRMAKQKPAPISETPAERLARLQKEKERVDEALEKLTGDKSKVRNK